MSQKDITLSVLNAHTDIVDNLSLIEVTERFANAKARSRNEFGTLIEKNINFLVNFFVFFKKSRQSRTEILIIVSIFKRL